LQPKETDCYAWHDSMIVTLLRIRPTRALPQPRVLCLQKRNPVGKVRAGRSVRRRVVPGGRWSPPRSKELSNYLLELQTDVVLLRRHTCASSVCGRPPRSLSEQLPFSDGAHRCGDRKPAVQDLCESRSRHTELACCVNVCRRSG